MAGPDSHHLTMIAPPTFSSAWEASEIAEVYWGALTRDVPFAQYSSSPLIAAAAADMSAFSDTTRTEGGRLCNSIHFVSRKYSRRCRWSVRLPISVETYPFWSHYRRPTVPDCNTRQRLHDLVRGLAKHPERSARGHRQFNRPHDSLHTQRPRLRRVATSRLPVPARKGYMDACLILLGFGPAALEPANPYLTSATQVGGSTFGGTHILDFVARAARAAAEQPGTKSGWCIAACGPKELVDGCTIT